MKIKNTRPLTEDNNITIEEFCTKVAETIKVKFTSAFVYCYYYQFKCLDPIRKTHPGLKRFSELPLDKVVYDAVHIQLQYEPDDSLFAGRMAMPIKDDPEYIEQIARFSINTLVIYIMFDKWLQKAETTDINGYKLDFTDTIKKVPMFEDDTLTVHFTKKYIDKNGEDVFGSLDVFIYNIYHSTTIKLAPTEVASKAKFLLGNFFCYLNKDKSYTDDGYNTFKKEIAAVIDGNPSTKNPNARLNEIAKYLFTITDAINKKSEEILN